ncbi:MAG: hypothetical protein M0Z87_11750 [Actinomycetota bacterium]|nr:hypothetical protein [Actinomycetota bacterium]
MHKGFAAFGVAAVTWTGSFVGGNAHSYRPAPVKVVSADVTSQVLPAAGEKSAIRNKATFLLSATSSGHRPAAFEPVTFYIGLMAPGSGVAPTTWIPSSSPAAAPYIAYASRSTDRWGHAALVLKGQTAQTMEMVAVKVGNLSGYNPVTNKAAAALDAWWTTPQSSPTAHPYDTTTVFPFMRRTSKSSIPVHVYTRHAGMPVGGVTIRDTLDPTSPSPKLTTYTTNRWGAVSYSVPVSPAGAVNVVKTADPSNSGGPFTGGMMAAFVPAPTQ